MGTLSSRHEISVGFNKICVFCDKYYVRIDKCVFIVIKIKYVNFDRINDIYDKINSTINYTHFIIPNIYFIKTHVYIFLTHLTERFVMVLKNLNFPRKKNIKAPFVST